MEDCLFCKIIKGEVPSTKVYEDENTLAFLDINPTNIGHTLVIPKKHSENIFDIETPDLNNTITVVQKLSKAIKTGVVANGINIMSNNEKPAGQLIFHTHFHIIPRFVDDGFRHWQGKRSYSEGEEKTISEKIKNNL